MDHQTDLDTVRKKAIFYVQELLDNPWKGKSSLQTAQGIVGLAFDQPNPLKDVFAITGTSGKSRLGLSKPPMKNELRISNRTSI